MKFWFGKSQAEESTKTEETVVSPTPVAVNTPTEVIPDPSASAEAEAEAKLKEEEERAKAEAEAKAKAEAEAKAKEEAEAKAKAEEEARAKAAAAAAPAQPNPRELYYQLMNALYDAVLILDGSGHIVDCSERVKPVLGYERGDMWDMPVETVIKGIGPVIFNQMKEALHNDQQVLISAKCARKDGSVFQGEVSACLMRLKRGENFVLSVRNIEKRIAEIKEHLQASGAVRPEQNAAPGTAAVPTRRMVLKAVKRNDA